MAAGMGEQSSLPSQWDFIEALGDGVYGVDLEGSCLFVNRAGLRMLGYAHQDELIGRNMHALIHHTRPDGSPLAQADCPLLHTATSGHPVRLENELLWRRDNVPFHAEYSSFPVIVGGRITGCVITFSDISVRQQAQRRLATQHVISQLLAGTEEVLKPERVLEAIATGLGWDAGLFWQPSGDSLVCAAAWHAGAAQAASPAPEFLMQAWAGGKPVQQLAGHAAEPGLAYGFAFPVMDGAVKLGAMAFHSHHGTPADDGLLEMATALGHQIGQALARDRAAAALGESERLKAAILAASPDGVITVDHEARIVEFNAMAERMFGRPAAAVIGHDLAATIFPAETQALHRDAYARALRGDAAVVGRRIEVDVLGADGARFPVEFSMSATATGARPLFTVYLRDISARRREQARLRESEARFRTIANAIPQLSWMTDAFGAVVWYNQRWYDYTGSDLARMSGWGWKSVHHPDHIERVERRLRDCFERGENWEDTFPLRSHDGTYRWFLSRAVPIREEPDDAHPEGRVLGWFGSNTDVTEMRELTQTLALARDEAEDANRAKSTFIANMSHELRTPLSAIIGYSEMLIEEIGDGTEPADLARDVSKIEGNARHLLGLINDVLDLSKVESGKMEAYAETFDVAAMVRDVAGTVGALMEKKANRLELSLAEGVGSMHSDVTRIRQMLLNLLSNAAKFTEAGLITLSVAPEDREGAHGLRFAVADTGIGMTEEQLSQLFRRFQQADASTTRQFGGTGLGLALTKAFAALLGGAVTVASTPGQGSTFSIWLPATLAQPEVPAAIEAAVPDGRELVLVVDDDPTQLDLMSRFLAREGYAVQTAMDGPGGITLARRLRPWAILLDVTMPGMDGWSVLSALKADPELADIPVVMVTFVTERALASSLGAADYVLKPVDWNRLRHVMERFHSGSRDVLVVDDEADTRQRTAQVLEKNGWTVTEAANGQEALDHVARAIPRLILLDLNMPVMDGFDFLCALRQRPGCEAIPVVVLTAMDLSTEDRRRLRGANQVLNKGNTSLRDLAERLKQLGTDG